MEDQKLQKQKDDKSAEKALKIKDEINVFAKKARGAMARFIMERRLTAPEQLLDFDAGGYAYDPNLSKPGKPAFLRSEAAAKAA